jgi:hypothetical protein
MLAVALVFVAAPVLAADPKVAVQVDVVMAQLDGNTLDPPSLKAMQDALAKKVRYGTLKRLSSERYELTVKPTALKLPNEKDVATLKVRVPPADATYKLGRQGSLYVQGGAHQSGELWLVLSPAK